MLILKSGEIEIMKGIEQANQERMLGERENYEYWKQLPSEMKEKKITEKYGRISDFSKQSTVVEISSKE